eukprot:CAMPEP_0172422870 /NCGR_PEP_ID=MMETSP1064-20121228/8990_1 /TAXON_ID=202472 /ORGANISM="Aulacoseira subarctica , Strain CCAP 1002/5" /LENGTH=970 /DNA_ID=CAMNT_0013163953 /DNA_START=54 /DNA_END=2966 /DNA_ORIENTATION=+
MEVVDEFGRVRETNGSSTGLPSNHQWSMHSASSNRQQSSHHYRYIDYANSNVIPPHDRSESPSPRGRRVAATVRSGLPEATNSNLRGALSHHPPRGSGEIIVPRKSRLDPSAPVDASSRIPRRASAPEGRSSRSFSPPYHRRVPFHQHYQHTDRDDQYNTSRRTENEYSIKAYADEPMLCQLLWEMKQQSRQQKLPSYASLLQDEPSSTIMPPCDRDTVGQEHDSNNDNNNEESVRATIADVQKEGENNPVCQLATTERQKHDDIISYQEYKQSYCTNVIRSFFNAHLDDEWFRKRYSPHHRVIQALKERERAAQEANSIMNAVTSNKQMFITQSRLGIGKKLSSSQYSTKKRKNNPSDANYSEQETTLANSKEQRNPHEQQTHVQKDTSVDKSSMTTIPVSHLLSSQNPKITLKVSLIPPTVTDEQLQNAFEEHCRQRHTTKVAEQQNSPAVDRVCSTTVGGTASPHSHQYYCESLDRIAFVVFVNEDAKEHVLGKLRKMNAELKRGIYSLASAPHSTHLSGGGGSRRRDCDILEMDLDCSDPFGRVEIDADGKGSAPPSDAEPQRRSKASPLEEIAPRKIPIRKTTILVHSFGEEINDHHSWDNNAHYNNCYQQQQLAVLTAAVSSKKLITRNKTSALMIARALDRSKSIPSGSKLDDLITILFGDDGESNAEFGEDVLDVAIAYLRRVHLFSFYTGQKAMCEGDMLAGIAGAIHLRLEDAEAILAEKEAASSSEKIPIESDLLVQRLNNVISNAMEESTARLACIGVVVSPEVDSAAEKSRNDEVIVKNQWLEDHSVLDADGRARCSFHFCKKLFKDKTFLNKHLLKKHPEYLAGEQAKCHDKYMMEAWEQDEMRPVPRIVVDCGHSFGLIKVSLRGAQPIAEDPEPALRQEILEKQRKVAEARAEQQRQKEQQQRQKERWHAETSLREKLGFIDVDDMAEEQVKLAFDQVEFPPLSKKRKKKKKLA